MAEITAKELEALQDGFDTFSLIHAIDELDKMRGHLNDREHHNPPEIRNDILKLHDLAMDVVNHGVTSRAQALFELATEIEDQLSDLSEALENIQEAIAKLTDLHPESLRWGD
jgi:chromosome segregation ATPase